MLTDYFREGGKGERETSAGCLPDWGLNPQPSYVPWPRDKKAIRYKVPQNSASPPVNTSVTSSIPELVPTLLSALDPISFQTFQNLSALYRELFSVFLNWAYFIIDKLQLSKVKEKIYPKSSLFLPSPLFPSWCVWTGFSHFLTTTFSLSATLVKQWFLK